MFTRTASSTTKSLGRIIVLSALVAMLAGAVADQARAELWFTDGGYVRRVIACKSGLGTSRFTEAAYANMRGISVRYRRYTYHSGGYYVNAWGPWTGWTEMKFGEQYLTANQVNALPDGKYLWETQYKKLVGGVLQYRSEYVPVYQYDDGFIDPKPLLWGGLPRYATCQLGYPFVVTW
jgi:hypothetical protein